jgi:glycosyltransferase involved in cell wall biosynthesis
MAKTKVTALLHTHNHGLQLVRALDSLRPCDEVLVVDHASADDTVKVARDHGARVVQGVAGVDHGAYAHDAQNDWILCLLPSESLAEELEASLLEWREEEHAGAAPGFNVGVRMQNGEGWKFLPAEMRLVNRKQLNWVGDLPPLNPNAPSLKGHLLRIPKDGD